MDIHKVIEGLKEIDAKIGTEQLTKWVVIMYIMN
jgi:hypothetical protein